MRRLGADIWALDSSHIAWKCKGFNYICKKNKHENWERIHSSELFASLEASRTCVWAVDFSHNVYLYVKECDCPIGFQEYRFEYERWLLGRGWRKVEREDSTEPRALSSHWTTDSVWRIDRNVEGSTTDSSGWQYATSFTSTFTDTNTATSYVRRMRLARYHTYNKMGTFAKLDDYSQIKFLNVAAGGTLLPRSEDWPICVWAVSKDCKAYFRENVSNVNPEGDSWSEVCLPDFEISTVSVGPKGNVWCITTQGEIVTRLGITNENLTGTYWVQVPVHENRLSNIFPASLSITADSVWMVDSKNRAFFHWGCEVFEVDGKLVADKFNTSRTSKWIYMIQEDNSVIQFRCITTGIENQVWALDHENKIYNRTEISLEQLAGQSWQLVEDPYNKTTKEDDSSDDDNMFDDTFQSFSNKHAVKLTRKPSDLSLIGSMRTMGQSTVSRTTYPSQPHFLPGPRIISPEDDTLYQNFGIDEPDDYFNSVGDSEGEEGEEGEFQSIPAETNDIVCGERQGIHFWKYISAGGCTGAGINQKDIINKQAELSKSQLANIKKCRTVILDRLRVLNTETRDRDFDQYIILNDDGGCRLRTNANVEYKNVWYQTTIYLSTNIPHGHLRFSFFRRGQRRLQNEDEQVGEGTSFKKRRQQKYLEPTVIVNHTSTVEEVIAVPLIELRGIKRVSPNVKEKTVLLYTAEMNYLISFERDTDSTNWFDRINDYVRAIHEVPNVPSNQSIWALTSHGTVYYSPPAPSCLTDHSKRCWLPVEGNFNQIAAGPRSIVWAVSPDNNIYCFTRGYGGGNHNMGQNLENFSVRRHFRAVVNQRYSKLRRAFYGCADNDRINEFVDEGGNSITTVAQYHLPHSFWRWTGEWFPETSSKTDADGWMYARNFHSPFSSSRTNGVRKRTFMRPANMSCNAPWKQIPLQLIKVVRVSLEHYCYKDDDESVAAWALCSNGNLLYRVGVTSQNPMGERWEDVTSDHKIVDISLDAYTSLWAICEDGSAYFRVDISRQNPSGKRWMHMIKPAKDVHLVRIAAGKYNVWAISDTGICYVRTRISVNKKYGESWERVNTIAMSSISINCSDQVFGVRESDKAIVTRSNVTGENLKGETWSVALENDWKDVCITSTCFEHHWDEVDELIMHQVNKYRTSIWVMLRENYNKFSDEEFAGYHHYQKPIGPLDEVLVRDSSSGLWYKNIIDHIGKDGHLKIRNGGVFTTTYETVLSKDVVLDESPHYTHINIGTKVLARLSLLTKGYTECTVKECLFTDRRGEQLADKKVVLDPPGKVSVNELRIPPAKLQADIFFLDRRRSSSFFTDERGNDIIVC